MQVAFAATGRGGDLPWAALAGTVALCKRARGGFQIPKSLQSRFAGMRLAAEELPVLPGWLVAPQNLGLLLGCCNHPMVPMRRGSGSQPGAGQERPRAPRARLPAAWARGTAAQRAPAESLLPPAPAQRSREHRGDMHAAPACCWICSAGGDVQTHRGCSSLGLSSSSVPDPREMPSHSLSSAEGRARCPRATGS